MVCNINMVMPLKERNHTFVVIHKLCVRICIIFYNQFSLDTVTIVNTSNTHLQDEYYFINENITDTEDEHLNSVVQSDNNDTDDDSLSYTVQLDNDEISVSTNVSINNNDLKIIMKVCIWHTDKDITLDATEENISNKQGFITIDAGDSYNKITQSHNTEVISGHVISNKVGSCTSRKNHIIYGTSRQRHFVQNLCSKYSGQSYPLLYS